MRVTEEELKKILIEMYASTFKLARDRKQSEYEVGKYDGLHEATSAIMLQVFGGRTFMRMWEICLNSGPFEDGRQVAEYIEESIKEMGDGD